MHLWTSLNRSNFDGPDVYRMYLSPVSDRMQAILEFVLAEWAQELQLLVA